MTETDFTIYEYTDTNGHSPYARWLKKIRDKTARARIMLQIERMRLGLSGDWKPIGDGLSELRIHYGPGYRVYYGKPGKRIVLILGGGNKRSQQADISLAKSRWKDYRTRHPHGTSN